MSCSGEKACIFQKMAVLMLRLTEECSYQKRVRDVRGNQDKGSWCQKRRGCLEGILSSALG